MATIFTHAATAILVGKSFIREKKSWRFWYYLAICSILPDIDVLGFKFGIKYGDFWGHRGFTHSILFAFLLGLLISFVFYHKKKIFSWNWWGYVLLYTSVIASHGLFDAMTDGGLGIAFFSPFNNTRYFLPWTPIKVSPIGAQGFFNGRGVDILINESIWIITPMLLVALVLKSILKRR